MLFKNTLKQKIENIFWLLNVFFWFLFWKIKSVIENSYKQTLNYWPGKKILKMKKKKLDKSMGWLVPHSIKKFKF